MPKRRKRWTPPGQQPRETRQRHTRPNANARGYGRRWRKAAKHYLIDNPLCAVCAEAGRVEAAVLVDHVLPAVKYPKLFWDRNNWQGLCRDCHGAKTGRGE